MLAGFLANATVIGHIEDAITATGTEAEWLILQITESAVMEDPEEAAAVLANITALGICLFTGRLRPATGSLSYLQRLLNMPLRQGIETRASKPGPSWTPRRLWDARSARGYLISCPLAATAFQTWLENYPRAGSATPRPSLGLRTPSKTAPRTVSNGARGVCADQEKDLGLVRLAATGHRSPVEAAAESLESKWSSGAHWSQVASRRAWCP
jgi:hypothetical protein